MRDQNNSSRLGVKGEEDTGFADLEVFYQLESGIDPDGSKSNPFSERSIFAGVEDGSASAKDILRVVGT